MPSLNFFVQNLINLHTTQCDSFVALISWSHINMVLLNALHCVCKTDKGRGQTLQLRQKHCATVHCLHLFIFTTVSSKRLSLRKKITSDVGHFSSYPGCSPKLTPRKNILFCIYHAFFLKVYTEMQVKVWTDRKSCQSGGNNSLYVMLNCFTDNVKNWMSKLAISTLPSSQSLIFFFPQW